MFAILFPILVTLIIVLSPKTKDKSARNVEDFETDWYYYPRILILIIFCIGLIISITYMLLMFCFNVLKVRRIGSVSNYIKIWNRNSSHDKIYKFKYANFLNTSMNLF